MAKLKLSPDAPPEPAAPAAGPRRWAFAVANEFVRFHGEIEAATAEAAADQVKGWLTAGVTVVAAEGPARGHAA
jgi:hypothetical protein